MATLTTKIQIRRDTASKLSNVVPAQGELVYATDTKKFVIGDGSTTFTNLKDIGVSGISGSSGYLTRLATVSGGNTSTYPWRRIMSIPSTTSSWVDVVGTYYLSSNYKSGVYYLFRVEFRTNNSPSGDLGSFQISVIATNTDPSKLAIAYYSVASGGITTNYADIFVKVQGYTRMTLTRLSSEDTGTIKYYNSGEGNNSSSRNEAYTGINGNSSGYASMDLHSMSSYTGVAYGALSATVNKAYNLNNFSNSYTGATSDANNALLNGFYYISGGSTRPSFSQSTSKDYRILTTANSNSWLQQIATDFRCDDIFYRRRENGTWKSWKQFAFKDDILDPISYYWANVNISTTSSTATEPTFANIKLSGSTGITNLPIGGGIYWNPYVESATDSSDAASISLARTGPSGGTTLIIRQQNDAADTIQFVTNASSNLYHNTNKIWDAGNDGHNSGLDADTIDGLHATSLMRNFTASNGVDVNTITDSGSYRLQGTWVNGPTGVNSNHGQLLVVHGASDTAAQLYFPYNETTAYLRTGNAVGNSGGTWKTWRKLAFKDDIPIVPTVNDATLTIQKNGSKVASFTANSSTDVTANIIVPTKLSELDNDKGFITSAPDPVNYYWANVKVSLTSSTATEPTFKNIIVANKIIGDGINEGEVSFTVTDKGWALPGDDDYGCIYPLADDYGKIGIPTNYFYASFIKNMHSNMVLTKYIKSKTYSDLYMEETASGWKVGNSTYGNIFPSVNNTGSLGLSSHHWNSAYIDTINLGAYGKIGTGTPPSSHMEKVPTIATGAIWMATTGGGGESAGILADGDKVMFWAPQDNPMIYMDSDNGTTYNMLHTGNAYWANIKVSTSSSSTTSPTFKDVYPSAHDTGSLGLLGYYWNLLYVNTIEAWTVKYYDLYNKSDKRVKTNITESSLNALSIINNTKIHEYKYKHFENRSKKAKIERKKAQEKLATIPKTKENREIRKKLTKIIRTPNNSAAFELGIIAQELESILPKEYKKAFISKQDTKENNGELGIKISNLIPLLWKGMQEQQELINNLSARIKELEERLGDING